MDKLMSQKEYTTKVLSTLSADGKHGLVVLGRKKKSLNLGHAIMGISSETGETVIGLTPFLLGQGAHLILNCGKGALLRGHWPVQTSRRGFRSITGRLCPSLPGWLSPASTASRWLGNPCRRSQGSSSP